MVISAFQLIHQSLRNNRKLYSNAFYLYIFQGLNYLLPLITIPYLLRVLKTDTFGKLIFYGAFMTYFQIILDYGFNLSATRDASLVKKDPHKLSNLFFSVLIIKITMMMICAVFLTMLLFFVPRFQSEIPLCIWLFLGIVATILFPTWLFQGMEEMRYISIFNLANKLAVTCLYFILIRSPADYLWYAYLNSGGALVIGCVAFFVAIHKFRIRFSLPGLNQCRTVLENGFQIFISQASTTLFTNTNIFLLGIFTNNLVVGNYAVADKIVRAVISLTGPIGTAIYPRTAVLFSQSRDVATRFLRKIALGGSALFGLTSLGLFLFADLLVLVVSGSRSSEIALFIRIMSILPLSVFMDNIYGTQIMLNVNLQKQFMRIILVSGLFSVFLLVVLVPHLKGIGSAITFLLSEIMILSLMVMTVRKSGIHLLPIKRIARKVSGNLFNLLRYCAMVLFDKNYHHAEAAMNGRILRAKIVSSFNPGHFNKRDHDFEHILSIEQTPDRSFRNCRNSFPSGAKRKILILSPVYGIGYGVGLVIEKQMNGLVEMGGHKVYLGVPDVEKQYPGNGGFFRNVGLDLASTHTLIEEINPDIIISHADPYYGHVANYKKGYVRKIAYDHGEPFPDFFGFWDSINFKIKEHRRRSAFRSFDVHISISEFIKKSSGVARSIVIYNGADHILDIANDPIVSLRKDFGLPDDSFIVLSLARMGPAEALYKGFDVLALIKKGVEMLVNNQNIQFVLMGKSYQENSVVKERLRNQGFRVIENVGESGKRAYLSQSNIFISPSLWEGFNLPLVEAQSLGIPAICLSVGAHPEVCPFAFNTIDDIVRFILFLYENPAMLNRASSVCRKFVSNFTWNKNVVELLNIVN